MSNSREGSSKDSPTEASSWTGHEGDPSFARAGDSGSVIEAKEHGKGLTDTQTDATEKRLDDEIEQAFDDTVAGKRAQWSSADALLRKLTTKNDDYRYITFPVPDNAKPAVAKSYRDRVSFDTVNLDISQDNNFGDEDDDYDFYTLFKGNSTELSRGRERARSPSPAINRIAMSGGSPSRVISPMRSGSDMGFFYNTPRAAYPTTPIITHRGCTYTKTHRDFENLYSYDLFSKEHNYLRPVLPSRTILVYISGRRHSWVALDWVLHNYIEHGDTVVISSAVPPEIVASKRRRKSAYSSYRGSNSRVRSKPKPQYLKLASHNIMRYALEVVNPDIIAKISVDLTVGYTKDVLKDMYKLYEPNLVCLGAKQNSRISAPLRSWRSSKITDRLVKNFPLPVIVAPAMNMRKFELNLADEIQKRYSVARTKGALNTTVDKPKEDVDSLENLEDEFDPSLDNESIISEESASSAESQNSYSSFTEILSLYKNYKSELSAHLHDLSEKEANEDYYANMLRKISDESAFLCREIRELQPDITGKGAKLAIAITGSTSYASPIYKTKSMLDPIETVKSEESLPYPAMTYKDLKKKLKENERKSGEYSDVPKITIHSPAQDAPSEDLPKTSSLKFAEQTKPSEEQKSSRKSKSLAKSLSHEMDPVSSRPKIHTTKSNPDIFSVSKSSDDKDKKEKKDKDKKRKKKKKKRFLGLF
ncbi:Piso0_001798 [Millerozyma farinosa CBS 7064]|uniref:Piso0_001798 protein n=1 Tax=Pichia sorbitophila (strain ATCC MYA-4447 / BCRC 22081 / CBS 7064 / NBRC 10061 / NRRL Y-12695) TaxID=559304 RepID=G8YP46_PICSO|nr:Piso0_001798 [Millerozyma farinosa CBS 7064]